MDLPIVFISSTKEDLESYRLAARDAAMRAGFHPIMMEYFAAGGNPPLQTCMEKVQPCDVLIVIVAHRYGWIPEDQPGNIQKSITWLECEQALKNGKKVIAFLVDEKCPWKEELKENYRLTKAMNDNTATHEFFQEVNSAIQQLKEFKTWLKKDRTVVHFANEHNLGELVIHALMDWNKSHGKTIAPKKSSTGIKKPLDIPFGYRGWLLRRCGNIELLAHLLKQGCAPPRLSSVYVPAPTIAWEIKKPKENEQAEIFKEEELHLLLDRFGKESLYVPGLAGSGKSTFARWVAYLLCQGAMPDQIQLDQNEPIIEKFPGALKDKLPLLIPFREFWPFLSHYPGQRELSSKEMNAALERWATQKLEQIDWPAIDRFMTQGKTVLLFDGVDEIPISVGASKQIYYPREMMIAGLKNMVPEWLKKGNRILLTSRPYGLEERDAQAMGLSRSEIIDLPTRLQHLFIKRWFTALAYENDMPSFMIGHLSEREELAPLVGHPVLLMAMCILFPEGRRLPQDKAELYQKTIDRLLFNRYGDATEIEKVHRRLNVIAYGMHTGEGLGQQRKTPQAEITYDEIDRVLSHYMEQRSYKEKGFTTVAQAREELLHRSGLLIPKEKSSAAFYHLSFQEYLAGQQLVQLAGDKLDQVIAHHADVREWRQTLDFAFGAALSHSPEKVINMLNQMIRSASTNKLPHLVLTADLVEIIYRKNLALEKKLEEQFQNLCLAAIEQEVSLAERYDVGRTLGLVGDPRIVIDLRHPPVGFIRIPAGDYRIGEKKNRTKIDHSFFLSKYPVTNAQYQLFIDEGGYKEDKWWSEEGRKWRDEQKITEPELWRNGRWNGANLPVVGVSFYEAEAFCNWAGGRLPTELEWEAAARGPNGYKYAWGDNWENGICNHWECGLNKTSPVGLFPRSRSRDFELEDMTGNVWEWCADWYDKTRRVLRGGSWLDVEDLLPCSGRNRYVPDLRNFDVGFRVSCGA
ncbi:SUMF1/EgtB/PvdO family nonheme iron enzyme [candidate division KSB1 bacterium]|nr:SUMF1/EgtB/PvdO family nonheme iron enzyme [candidate division KSB1 bacterium]